MATTHIVKVGESLTTIALKYGYSDGLFLYNHPSNAGLRKRRPNPNIILPGDTVNIPDKTPGSAAPKTEFSLVVIDSISGKPFPGLTAKLKLPDGTIKEFVTDSAGSIKLTEPDVQQGRVDLQDLTDKTEVPEIGDLTPPRIGLPTNASNVVHAPNKRAVINAVAAKFSIARRSAWGKMKPNYSAIDSDWDYEIVTLHHSGGSGEKDPPTIEEKHMKGRGWDDVGYHYIIEPNGDVYEGRYLSKKGSHVEAANTGKIGILVTGDFETEGVEGTLLGGVPTSSQLTRAVHLINVLKASFPTLKKLGGHRDYKPTTVCPGNELYKLIPGLRAQTSLGGP